MHELTSCHLKIGRAKEHLETLGRELSAWAKTESMRVIKESEDGGRTHRVFVEVIEPAPLARWSLVAGDCVHNLRSALDSLLYGIAIIQTGQNPPPDEKKIQFPIVTDAASFQGEVKRRLQSLSPAVTQALETFQPYNRPHSDLPPLLGILSVLSNQEKHRMLNVGAATTHSASVELPTMSEGSKVPSITATRTAITGKNEILSFTVEPPEPNLKYRCTVDIPICLQHAPGPSKSPFNELATVLTWLIEEVEEVVRQVTAVI
jgi:hypothetical protein